jgi:hypothetical protein
MPVTNYWQWIADGSPWSPATCIADFAATMRGHDYTVYTLGDVENHLKAPTPEDHCPYSATPWPGTQPYPRVLACDIMPGGVLDWRTLGEKIHADKLAGRPGTEWIKYMNYEDRQGNCWHASWEGAYTRRSSTDRGHIHISGRTDHVNAHTGYDPLAADLRLESVDIDTGDDEEMTTSMVPQGFAFGGPDGRKDLLVAGGGLGPVNGGQFGNKRAVLGLGCDFSPAAGVQLRVAVRVEDKGWQVQAVTVHATDNRAAIFLPDGATKFTIGRVKRATGDEDTVVKSDGSTSVTASAEMCPVWWDLEFEKR